MTEVMTDNEIDCLLFEARERLRLAEQARRDGDVSKVVDLSRRAILLLSAIVEEAK